MVTSLKRRVRAARPKVTSACSILCCVLVVRSTTRHSQDSGPGLDLAVEGVGDPRHAHGVVVQAR